MKKILIGFTALAMAAGMSLAPISAGAADFVDREAGLGDLFTLDMLFNIGQDNKAGLGDLFILDQLFPVQTAAQPAPVSLATQMSGRILLQVEENGEAWYVNPATRQRIFMGNPGNAYQEMGNLALGISNADFDAAEDADNLPANIRGRFLLKVEEGGRLYYANPVNGDLIFVGSPADAGQLIGLVGLGISNADLEKIPVQNGG